MATTTTPASAPLPNSQHQRSLHPTPAAASNAQALTVQLPHTELNVRVTETPTDYVTPSIQIAVAIFSAAASVGAIMWQMRRQQIQSADLHRKSVKSDLQLDAYRDFQNCFREFNDRTPEVDLRALRTAFAISVDQSDRGQPQYPLTQRAAVLIALFDAHQASAIGLIYFLERYESLLPSFEIFKTALSCALHDIRVSLHPFNALMSRWLPIDNPDYARNPTLPQFIHRPTITRVAVMDLDAVSEPLLVAFGQLQCWATDLSIDVQNFLLGEYAEKKVERRVPLDACYFTVSIDEADSKRASEIFRESAFFRSIADAQAKAAAKPASPS